MQLIRRIPLLSLILCSALGGCVDVEGDDPEFRDFEPLDGEGLLDDGDIEVADPAAPEAGDPEFEPVDDGPALPGALGQDGCDSSEDNETCTRSGTGAICSEGRHYAETNDETEDGNPILENMDDEEDRVVNCGCNLYTCTISPMAAGASA